MLLARTTRRRLAAAVTTVMAVTLGAGALTVPASAVPVAGGGPVANTANTADAATTAADPIPYPAAGRLVGAGVTGFLTAAPDGTTTWRRYADGAGQAYGAGTYLRSTRTTDYLVFQGTYKITQRNLSTSGSLEIPVGSAAGDAKYVGAAGDAVFTTLATEAGTVLRRHTEAVAGATVTVLPADAISLKVEPVTPDRALVTFLQGGKGKWGLIDLATGAVGDLRDRTTDLDAVSATRKAWATGDATNRPPQVFVEDLATGAEQEVPVAAVPSLGNFHVGLVGDWVVYGQKGGMSFSQPSVHFPLTAYNLTTKTSVKLLDHAYELAPAPDGSLYARGGLVGQGEGMYRIADTGNQAPQVEKVATTGEPTEVLVTDGAVPGATLDLDGNDGFTFRWNLSRATANVAVTVRHVRTGTTRTFGSYGTKAVAFDWQDNDGNEDLYNGDYTWEIVARPYNGIGPDAVRKGTFKVVRKTQPHDFNDNGTPDLLVRDSAGRLWRSDLFYRPVDEQHGIHRTVPTFILGSGWNIYDRIEAGGDLGGSAVGDLLARDKSGVLWLYPGTGTGNFGIRIKVGGGWQAYDRLTFGGDLTNDGRTDALAVDKSGGLWLYPGTGNAAKPFAPRKKVGNGWGVYNDITAVGNIAGGTAGDLVARDRSGVLWEYLGKGDGTFAARTKVGGGWNAFRQLIGSGDADGDGRADLMGISATRGSSKLYKGTGDWRAPFRSAETMYLEDLDGSSDLVF
ncbi:FG-GAP repeat domain-containing protein [Streptomyces sp. NPDC004284]|uniref:FG-GAP repeat domain-containing protein n=1 Tax=Streptomyces sp. NPDC004284 TaxID=3364695 RepID=UPI003683BE96